MRAQLSNLNNNVMVSRRLESSLQTLAKITEFALLFFKI